MAGKFFVKFLIVDDSSFMRKTIISTILGGKVFTDENTIFMEAADGIQGLEAARLRGPHIILVDWNMPNMDGYEMIQEVRKWNPKIPIIMITIEGTEDRIEKAMAKGMATDYIEKPLEPGVLEKKLLAAFEALRSSEKSAKK